jgi:hypothetical protein
MFDDGVLTQEDDGHFRVVSDPAEQDYLKVQIAQASKQKYANIQKREGGNQGASSLVN